MSAFDFVDAVVILMTMVNVVLVYYNWRRRHFWDERQKRLDELNEAWGEDRAYFLLMTGFKLAVHLHVKDGIEPNAWRAAAIALHDTAHQVVTGHSHLVKEDAPVDAT